MSDAFLVRRGGSGGLSTNSAVIHVTADAGSTISFTKGGVIAKVLGPDKAHVKASDNSLAEWYYAISPINYGEWTVTATLGIDTASNTVTIDSNKQYDLSLYVYWLYKYGDERISRTGGWTSTGYTISGYSISPVTKNADNLTMSGSVVAFGTEDKIYIAGYSTLKVNVKSANTTVTAVFTKAKTNFAASGTYIVSGSRNNAGIIAVDLSNVSQLKGYIGIYKVSSGTVVIDKIWLE